MLSQFKGQNDERVSRFIFNKRVGVNGVTKRMDALTTPLNWQRVRIGDIAEIKRGASPRPIENPKWFCANSNVGWVRISDISKNSRFLYKTAQKLSKKGIEKSRLVK
ncbi:hypothetical protein ID1000_14080 [Helicobacter pylori]